MERLTARDKDGVYYPKCFEQCSGDPDDGDCLNCRFDEEIAERLAEYEDTGLTPEDLRGYGDIDFVRVIKLLRADAEGRLILRPPLNIGDTAYFILGGEIFEGIVFFIRWENQIHYGQHDEIMASVPYQNASVGCNFDDFGKTVFLTREEAQKALGGSASRE